MRRCLAFAVGLGLAVQGLGAAPVTLVSVLDDRPVFSYTVGGFTQTRAMAPGQRLVLEAGSFSGLGARKLALSEGEVYYLARFGPAPRLYVVGPDQVLLANHSGRILSVALGETDPKTGSVISGSFALGQAGADGLVDVAWGEDSSRQSQKLQPGHAYRFVLGSEEDQKGLTVTITPWD